MQEVENGIIETKEIRTTRLFKECYRRTMGRYKKEMCFNTYS